MTTRFIRIDPIHELLKAAQIVGLRPREVTLVALDQLAKDERERAEEGAT